MQMPPIARWKLDSRYPACLLSEDDLRSNDGSQIINYYNLNYAKNDNYENFADWAMNRRSLANIMVYTEKVVTPLEHLHWMHCSFAHNK